MSSLQVHIHQARHNKYFAYLLFWLRLPFRDWIVTVCFYAAVHIAESLFYVLEPGGRQHSHNTKPRSFNGGTHGWRKKLINDLINSRLLSRKFLRAYDILHHSSTISRYLVVPGRSGGSSIGMLASKYFSPDDIKGFIKNELAILETEAKPHIATILMPPNRISSLISKFKNLF